MKRFMVIALAACGGSQPPVSEPLVGDTHQTVTSPPPDAAVAPADAAAAPAPDGGAAVVPVMAGPSFELVNAGSADLNFGVTKGWGPVIFAYTGKPPKARSVILFESSCTASCDSGPEEICPVCKEPETKKEELAMARLETVPAGSSFKVPWDGKVRVYEKAPGGPKGCKCFRTVDPAPGTYTVKACGLRPPTQPGKPSRPVCTETPVTVAAGSPLPPVITLSFAK
jgi:hypothetical protein